MRKLFFLLACLVMGLLSNAQTTDVVGFTFVPNPATNSVVFTNTSVYQNNDAKKAFWSFGDGSLTQTAATAGTTHYYNRSGTYQVCLRVYRYSNINNDSTLVGYECKSVTIQERCEASFTALDTVIGGASVVNFYAGHYNNSGKPIIEVCWNFGDGSNICTPVPPGAAPPLYISHTYPGSGTYTACLRIKYDGGCVAEKCQVITVGTNLPDSCSANFNTIAVSSASLSRRKFIALPWHSNNKRPVKLCWQFGDGKDTCIQYSTSYTGDYFVEHIYSQPGQYNTCLTIKYDGGCEKTKCNPVVISSSPADSCKAEYTMQPITATPLGRKFVAQPWHSQNKKPVSVCWEFGDNKDTCIQYPANYTGDYWVEHKYAQAGQFQVCVKIKYDGGCESRKCNIINIEQPRDSCSVELNEVAVAVSSLERKFYVGLVPNRRAEKICWNFGDGTDTCVILSNPLNSQQLMITHRYAAPGNYTVCVKVYYAGGCITQKCKPVVINILQNNICGGFITDSVAGANSIRYKATSIHSPNDNVVSYNWTFGDGTSGSGQTVNHTYAASGRYNVCLFIRTASGCETKICKPVGIAGNSQPQLVLTPNPVTTVLNATFISAYQQMVSIRIHNANGVMVRSYSRVAIAGVNNWTFNDVATLPAGIYSAIVQSQNQFATAIFFKQ